jgi:hypothetical protein
MVDILLLQTVSIAIASAGVFIAAIYYILQIRHQTRMRQTDLLMRLCSVWLTKDWLEAWSVVDGSSYGKTTIDVSKIIAEHRGVEVNEVGLFFDEIGVLLQMRLVDIELVERLLHGHIKRTWEKLLPAIEYYRKLRNDPKILEGFEYLHYEMKKREQRK